MKFEWEGRTREIDVSHVLLSHSLVMQEYTGGSLVAWERTLMDPESMGWLKAVCAAYWLMCAQDGDKVKISGVDFPVLQFSNALTEGWKAELEAIGEKAAEPEDPTKPGDGPGAESPASSGTGSTGSPTAT